MAENILVTDSLSEQMIQAGARLLDRLDATDGHVSSAFWLYAPEERQWRLIIASPLVTSEGPRNFYRRVLNANQTAAAEENTIALHDIAATDDENRLVQLLRQAIHTEHGPVGIRFSRNTVNGHFIDDAYIYRSCSNT